MSKSEIVRIESVDSADTSECLVRTWPGSWIAPIAMQVWERLPLYRVASAVNQIAQANRVTVAALWDVQPMATTFRILTGITGVAAPVMSWWGSARIVEALAGSRLLEDILFGAGMYVGGLALLGVLPVALSSLERLSDNWTFELVFGKFTRKTISFSQEQLNDPVLAEQLKQVRERAVWRMMRMAQALPQMIRNIGMLLVTGYLVASTAPLLLPVLVGFAIPTMVLEVRHARRRAELEEKLAPEWGGLWDDLRNLMVAPSLAMLHQFGAATWFSRRYRLGLQSASKTEGTLENDAALKRVLAALLVAMGILLSLWTLLYRALSGDLTVGGLLLTTGAIAGLTGSLAEFASLMGQQWSQSKSIKDLTEFLEHPYSSAISTRYVPIEQEYGCEESTEGTVADGGDATITDHLVLEDVWYRYPSTATERYAVRGLSFSVKRGSVVAIVGPNGAGKSSTMGLMLRQLQPTRGSISINGKSIDQMTAEEFSGQVIMLPQELQHLNLTLRELLNLGRPLDPASDDAVWRALEHVGAAEFVRKWKNGLDTCLGHGRREAMEPSGGQLQRLLLTAVVIADRGLIVLDEPVSKVDSNAAKWFWNALFKEAKNRTVIFSTHQLGAVRRANMILFIADGSVTAQGTHDELMESCKAYRQLFDDQAGDYL